MRLVEWVKKNKTFVLFGISSLSAAVLDLVLFAILCYFLRQFDTYIWTSTIIARIASSLYVYLFNVFFTFKNKDGHVRRLLRFAGVNVVKMIASAGIVQMFVYLSKDASAEVAWKILTDTILFFVYYLVSKRFVFAPRDGGR